MGPRKGKSEVLQPIFKDLTFKSFVMTEDNLEHYVDVINAHKPAILRGYADSLYELSRYIEQKERNHLPLPSLSVQLKRCDRR